MEDILLLNDFCPRQLSLLALSSAPQIQKTLGRVVVLLLRIYSSKLQQVFAMRYGSVMIFMLMMVVMMLMMVMMMMMMTKTTISYQLAEMLAVLT